MMSFSSALVKQAHFSFRYPSVDPDRSQVDQIEARRGWVTCVPIERTSHPGLEASHLLGGNFLNFKEHDRTYLWGLYETESCFSCIDIESWMVVAVAWGCQITRFSRVLSKNGSTTVLVPF
jgi:hypothetical protein